MEFDGSLLVKCSRDVKLKLLDKQRMSLHCVRCHVVLGDSVGVCGEMRSLDSILCLRVTGDVVVSDNKELGQEGDMANCIFSSLKCRGCRSPVGKVIHSSPSRLAMIRSIFLLHKANISCYILTSSSMVNASTLTFDLRGFTHSMSEARQQFEAQLDQMSLMKSRLSDRSLNSQLSANPS